MGVPWTSRSFCSVNRINFILEEQWSVGDFYILVWPLLPLCTPYEVLQIIWFSAPQLLKKHQHSYWTSETQGPWKISKWWVTNEEGLVQLWEKPALLCLACILLLLLGKLNLKKEKPLTMFENTYLKNCKIQTENTKSNECEEFLCPDTSGSCQFCVTQFQWMWKGQEWSVPGFLLWN